ncbi:MAG: hypothetical protein GC181_03145 [Bacteroidetes bacterium]|nr:hypothetical protein [Bacteroidota bacterium]
MQKHSVYSGLHRFAKFTNMRFKQFRIAVYLPQKATLKKIWILLLFLSGLTGFVQSQNTLLYEISGNGLKKSSYLFGTMHLKNEELFNWNDKVFDAINACEVAAFELDLDIKFKMKDKRYAKIGKEWADYFTKEILPEMEKTIPADTLANRIVKYVVPAVINYAKAMSVDSARLDFVDQFLFNYAKKQGKKMMGIETMTEQLNVLTSIDKKFIKDALISFLKKDDWSVLTNADLMNPSTLLQSYSQHNLNAVCSEINGLTGTDIKAIREFYEKLLLARNDVMFKRTSKDIRKQSMFIGVGAGHLCGPNGLIEQYKKAGYTVKPVDITGGENSKLPEIKWKTYNHEWFMVDVPVGVDSVYRDLFDWNETMANNLVLKQGRVAFKVSRLENYMSYNEEEATEEEMAEEYEEVEEYDEEIIDDSENNSNEPVFPPMPVDPNASYVEKLKMSLMGEFVKLSQTLDVSNMRKSSEEMISFTGNSGETMELMYNKMTHSLSWKVEKEDPEMGVIYTYEIEMNGDNSLLSSPEFRRFFTSFKLK